MPTGRNAYHDTILAWAQQLNGTERPMAEMGVQAAQAAARIQVEPARINMESINTEGLAESILTFVDSGSVNIEAPTVRDLNRGATYRFAPAPDSWSGTASVGRSRATETVPPPPPSVRMEPRDHVPMPLLPVEQVLAPRQPLPTSLSEASEPEALPAAERYTFGTNPGYRHLEYDERPMTSDEREDLRMFADRWSRLTREGIDRGYLTIAPHSLYYGDYVNQTRNLSRFLTDTEMDSLAEPELVEEDVDLF